MEIMITFSSDFAYNINDTNNTFEISYDAPFSSILIRYFYPDKVTYHYMGRWVAHTMVNQLKVIIK